VGTVHSVNPLESLALLLSLVAFAAALALLVFYNAASRRALYTLWEALLFCLRYLRGRLRGQHQTAGPVELRRTFERLGPTYIKFGQLIASSSGLFPDRYVSEFHRCLDRVPPEPWPVVEETLTRALGRPPAQVFASIEPRPLASASIAQVYGVTLRDAAGAVGEAHRALLDEGAREGAPFARETRGGGEAHRALLDEGAREGAPLKDLVVKVQRRGLPELVRADLSMLHFFAELLMAIPRIRNANPRGIVAQFESSIFEELDFIGEAARMDEFNRIMGEIGRRDVTAPTPLHALCTREVLTMERLHGVRVDDVAELRRRGVTQEQAEAKLIDGMHAWFQCLIRYGFFHGDVHAGNLMMLDDGRIGFLDFGIIGRLSYERRRQIGEYLISFATRDFQRLARTMTAMGAAEAKGDSGEWKSFAADLEDAFQPFLTGQLADIDYTEILPKLIRNARKHGTRLPDDFVLVTRQMLYFDRYAKLLAPSLNLFADPRLMMTIGAEFMGMV
jgi:aarF domain-containing kinase